MRRFCDAFEVRELTLGASARVGWHRHSRATILCVVSGMIVEVRSDGTSLLPAGAIGCRGAGVEHALRAGSAQCTFLRIDVAQSRSGSVPSFLDLTQGAAAPVIARLRRELTSGDRAGEVAMTSAVLSLLALVTLRRPEKTPPHVQTAFEVIRSRFRESISLRDVARAAGLDAALLAKQFHGHFGRTVGDTIRAMRVEEAASLLRTTRLRTHEIAASCGFCDAAHLTRSFERLYGIPPSAYRRLDEHVR